MYAGLAGGGYDPYYGATTAAYPSTIATASVDLATAAATPAEPSSKAAKPPEPKKQVVVQMVPLPAPAAAAPTAAPPSATVEPTPLPGEQESKDAGSGRVRSPGHACVGD